MIFILFALAMIRLLFAIYVWHECEYCFGSVIPAGSWELTKSHGEKAIERNIKYRGKRNREWEQEDDDKIWGNEVAIYLFIHKQRDSGAIELLARSVYSQNDVRKPHTHTHYRNEARIENNCTSCTINTQIQCPVSKFNVEKEKTQPKKKNKWHNNNDENNANQDKIYSRQTEGCEWAYDEDSWVRVTLLLLLLVGTRHLQASLFVFCMCNVCLLAQNWCRCVHENGIKISFLKEFLIKTQSDVA